MPKNEFLPFANNSTSNVIEQTAYDTLDSRKTGFASGVAKSAQLNKVWRQSSIMAAAVGQFISDTNKIDVLDDGDVPKLAIELSKAISAGASGVKSFNGVVGPVTVSAGSNITITKDGNDFKIAAAGGGATGVTSVNGKTGAVTLTYSDVNAAPIASPTFTGVPAAPTAAKGTATTQLATTAFVDQAISSIGAGVVSLNNISGAVNLVAGSNVTITPSGKNISISASGGGGGAVSSVNGKTGAVTLTATDVGATTTTWVQSQGYCTQTWVQQQGYVKCTVSNTWTASQSMTVPTFDSHGWTVSGGGRTAAITPTSVQLREVGVGVMAFSAGTMAIVPVNGSQGSAAWNSQGLAQSGNASKPGGGMWGDLSDARTKEGISPVLDCLTTVKALRPVKYARIWSPEKEEVGFVADEVEKVLPDAVYEVTPTKIYDDEGNQVPMPFDDAIDAIGEGKPIKVLGFKTDIIAYMIGGIKELAEMVALQQAEIEILKQKIK